MHMYLKMHPLFVANKETAREHEETQFFTNNYYHLGVDWYLNLFPIVGTNNNTIVFEKSANYFMEPKAPQRIKTLLPNVTLVIITIDPAERAYSWYQHMRYHNSSVANKYSFYQILMGGTEKGASVDMDEIVRLRTRCLDPGNYFKHLRRWLNTFPLSQIRLVDGSRLKTNPIALLDEFQRSLPLDDTQRDVLNYTGLVEFSQQKGQYCVRERGKNKTRCLGVSKGRQYERMDEPSRVYLRQLYTEPNKRLYKLLSSKSLPIPVWLENFMLSFIHKQ